MKKINLLKALAILPLFALASCVTDGGRIEKPEVGDVYQIEWKNLDGHDLAYQLVKVTAIEGDKLMLAPNRLYYHEKVYCLAAGDYFSLQAAYASSKQEIKAIYDKGGVVDVFRLYEASCLGHDK